jgi:hypothetical protein
VSRECPICGVAAISPTPTRSGPSSDRVSGRAVQTGKAAGSLDRGEPRLEAAQHGRDLAVAFATGFSRCDGEVEGDGELGRGRALVVVAGRAVRARAEQQPGGRRLVFAERQTVGKGGDFVDASA